MRGQGLQGDFKAIVPSPLENVDNRLLPVGSEMLTFQGPMLRKHIGVSLGDLF